MDGFYSPYISSPYIWREPSPWNYNEDNVEIRGVLCYMDNDCICSDIKKKNNRIYVYGINRALFLKCNGD